MRQYLSNLPSPCRLALVRIPTLFAVMSNEDFVVSLVLFSLWLLAEENNFFRATPNRYPPCIVARPSKHSFCIAALHSIVTPAKQQHYISNLQPHIIRKQKCNFNDPDKHPQPTSMITHTGPAHTQYFLSQSGSWRTPVPRRHPYHPPLRKTTADSLLVHPNLVSYPRGHQHRFVVEEHDAGA